MDEWDKQRKGWILMKYANIAKEMTEQSLDIDKIRADFPILSKGNSWQAIGLS